MSIVLTSTKSSWAISHIRRLYETSKLGMAMRYMDCLRKEAFGIWLHPDNFNRDEGFNLSHAWHPVINMIQWSRGTPMGKKGQAEVGT